MGRWYDILGKQQHLQICWNMVCISKTQWWLLGRRSSGRKSPSQKEPAHSQTCHVSQKWVWRKIPDSKLVMICYSSSCISAICILVLSKVVTNYSYYFLVQFKDSLMYKKGNILPYLRYKNTRWISLLIPSTLLLLQSCTWYQSAKASTMSTKSSSGSELEKFNNPSLNQLLNQITSTKLERGNFLLWKTLALPILRSYKLEGHLSGKNPCPPMFLPISSENATPTVVNTEWASSSQMVLEDSVSTTIERTLNPACEAWITVDQLR